VRDVAVTVARGVLLLACGEFEAVFGQASAVILVRDAADLLVVPIHDAAIGGHLVKRRNAAGDRAIDALDVLRDHAAGDAAELRLHAAWDGERGALRLARLCA
jgi:hypothetical protein